MLASAPTGQTLDSQLDQLRKAGCTSRNIYREKMTGARAARLPDTGTEERSHQAARAGRDARRTRAQLQRQPGAAKCFWSKSVNLSIIAISRLLAVSAI
jgi:hypothetical protein